MRRGFGRGRHRDRAGFPEVAVGVDAEDFDFLSVSGGGGLNFLGVSIAEKAQTCGDSIALLFVTLEEDEHFALAEAFVGDFDAGVVLFGFGEGGCNRSIFDQTIGINLAGFGFVQEFQDFVRSSGGSGRGEVTGVGFVDLGGVLATFPEGADTAAFAEPALKAALTPYGQVLFMDGDTIELSAENFFYDGQFVEPREDFGAALAVEEALIELFADVLREASDFAGEGVFGVVVGLAWLRRFRRDVNQIFVVHRGAF